MLERYPPPHTHTQALGFSPVNHLAPSTGTGQAETQEFKVIEFKASLGNKS